MLTIDEIKDISFRRGRGYKGEDVDAFIDEVIVTVEQLKKEKSDLVRKMDILATKVEQYRADEETVRNALLTAQKTADSIEKEARAKAAKIVSDAESQAKAKINEANAVTAKQKELYIKLKGDSVNLRTELETVYKSHLKSIGELPTDAVLVRTQEELNKKFPTKEVEEPVKNEPAAPAENVKPDETNDVEYVPAADDSKFDDLKFGDNYDVGDE